TSQPSTVRSFWIAFSSPSPKRPPSPSKFLTWPVRRFLNMNTFFTIRSPFFDGESHPPGGPPSQILGGSKRRRKGLSLAKPKSVGSCGVPLADRENSKTRSRAERPHLRPGPFWDLGADRSRRTSPWIVRQRIWFSSTLNFVPGGSGGISHRARREVWGEGIFFPQQNGWNPR